MPFGLTGAPSSFQRLMDKVLRGLPFVIHYIDDILVHSANEEEHKQHLRIVLERLQKAGLTLRGKKCCIGLSEVPYLGHVFSDTGMAPDPKKVKCVQEWPRPADAHALRQFLGLASYYRRYIHQFANIANPLNNLTQKGVAYNWTPECEGAFCRLKGVLTSFPVLTFPQFGTSADEFVLQTDASDVGIGAVLEQGGHVVAYASRSLSKSERNYSVIQKECLAAVYGMKQFRHYLLGRRFKLLTDHAPLQWLSAQKMEGLLCRWALAIQENDFHIAYRKGSLNSNADALSRRDTQSGHCALTVANAASAKAELYAKQQQDPVTKRVYTALKANVAPRAPDWQRPPLRRYKQLWSQLTLEDDIVCRKYSPHLGSDVISVPVLPASLHQSALHWNHDIPTAGHQGFDKTLQRLRSEAYWVNMARDVDAYCRQCTMCQQAKLPSPTRAPLTNIPIGQPWEMIAVDILEVPVSCQNNRYLLVVQDYFTKWATAIALPDQTAVRITRELVKLFSEFGVPSIVHSDQGRNFESTVLRQTLDAFGVSKSHTTAYHPQGDGMVERMSRSLLQLLRSYVETQDEWERYLPLVLFAYRTAVHATTGVSPFVLMFGRSPQISDLSTPTAFDSASYQTQLQAKLAELQDFVECHTTQAASKQKATYDKHSTSRLFRVGDTVWLSIPTAGKLDPRWEGRWVVKSVKSPLNMEITDGTRTKVVHVNRLHQRVQPHDTERTRDMSGTRSNHWTPPQVDHYMVPTSPMVPPSPALPPAPPPPPRYPQRGHQRPDRLTYY